MTTAPATLPKKYHPSLVTLHWLIAILIILNVVVANLGDEGPRGGEGGAANIAGIPIINFHMALGIIILALLIARLVVRFTTSHPAWANTGNAILNKVGEVTHWALYLLTFGMTITGILLATQTNRLAGLFGLAGSQPAGQFPSRGQFPPGGRFPPGGFRFGLGGLHGMIWVLLLLLILLHVGAAFYHQFILKDSLLKRMWYGSRYD